jgi:hypothetical protein
VAAIVMIVALAWAAAVGDVVYETGSSDPAAITAFGQVILTGTEESRTWILAALVASATLLLAVAVALVISRRSRRHTARAVTSAVEDGVGRTEAGMGARHELLAWRISELERRVTSLENGHRQTTEEVSPSRRQAYERSGLASGERRILSELSRAAESDEETIELPETDVMRDRRDVERPPAPPAERDDRFGF